MLKKYICRLIAVIVLPLFPVSQVFAETVLQVGDESFLRYELDEVVKSLLPGGAWHGNVSDKTRLKYTRQAIDMLTERALLYRAAKQAGFKVDADALEKAEKRNIDHFGSREEFIKQMTKSGLTYDRFKTRVLATNVITKFANQTLIKQASYSDKGLKQYYDSNPKEFKRPESVGVWHIIIKVPPNATKAERKKKKTLADSLVKRIRKGEKFTDIASKHSEDDYRIKGGWIGHMHKGRMLQELEDAVFKLKKGEIAGPIKTLQGYHIVKAGDRIAAGDIPFDEARVKLKKRLEQERFNKLRTAVLDKQRKQVKIKVLVKLE